jgi:AAA domain
VVALPFLGENGCNLYVSIVTALGAAPRFHKAEVMAQAANLLATEELERHRRVVIVVDEAHLLTPAQLEELRLLTSADMDSRSPFAGILVGQPMLARQLRMGVFAALDQRIATRISLAPMDSLNQLRTCAITCSWPAVPTRSSPTRAFQRGATPTTSESPVPARSEPPGTGTPSGSRSRGSS